MAPSRIRNTPSSKVMRGTAVSPWKESFWPNTCCYFAASLQDGPNRPVTATPGRQRKRAEAHPPPRLRLRQQVREPFGIGERPAVHRRAGTELHGQDRRPPVPGRDHFGEPVAAV